MLTHVPTSSTRWRTPTLPKRNNVTAVVNNNIKIQVEKNLCLRENFRRVENWPEFVHQYGNEERVILT
jgi:hypothetical protein